MRLKRFVLFISGVCVFVGLQAIWLIVRTALFADPMIFVFQTTTGGTITVAGLFISSLTVGMISRANTSKKFSEALAFYFGVAVGLPIAMYWVSLLGESSNLWPIALVMGWVELAVLIGVGWLAGLGIRKAFTSITAGQA